MNEWVITDNSAERLTLKWDGERFALIYSVHSPNGELLTQHITLLNPREAELIAKITQNIPMEVELTK